MRFSVVREIARKELRLFFSSPIGYLFLALFLGFTLFVFFWSDAFFARNIADVRPMFEALPILLIFLSAAITMRMWSEERRTGTLEFVATLPASTWEFVTGKFLACWLLLAIALVLTLPLPITLSMLANIDWGPVLAGYLAALLLGAAYLSVGLFVSGLSSSQIVALLVTVLVCGFLYALGAPLVTDYTGGWLTEFLYLLGSGSRFDSITRGVIDFRDLYYYLSIAVAFLALNVYVLTSERWSAGGQSERHTAWRLGTGLLIVNVLVANVWLHQFSGLRVDVTEGKIYSVSDATRTYLSQLREPLTIRGYFTEKTHPLLAPLVPRMKDLLSEYEVAGAGQVRVEILDPKLDPEAEDEANTKYGIRPVPFQVADRYQSSLVNAYFDVLVIYGDEYEVLSFRDLIEVKVIGEAELDVQLRNPEFDLTRSIKKVLYGFQGGDSLFTNIADPVQFKGYLSASDKLPEALNEFQPQLVTALNELVAESDNKFSVEFVDPEAGDGALAQQLAVDYGLQPMMASLFGEPFYYYLLLEQGDTLVQLPLPDPLTKESAKKTIEDGLKRYATGLVKSVGLVTPPPPAAPPNQFGTPPPQGNQFAQLRDFLQSDFNVEDVDLDSGVVGSSVELLMLADPKSLSDKAIFAVDQYLMRGGTVVLLTAPFDATVSAQSLVAAPSNSGLDEWLQAMGVKIGEQLVMDPRNAQFPVPVTRQAGGFSFQEIIMLDYPYFVDVQPDGMADVAMMQNLPQVTMPWSSPIEIDAPEGVESNVLLSSSEGAWLSSDTDVVPKFDESGLSAFVAEGETAKRNLAVELKGRFTSYFKDKSSPLLEADEGLAEESSESESERRGGSASSVIERSPESARLFVFASNGFVADQTLRMIGAAENRFYGNSVQMLANLVDWSLEDDSLTAIRGRGHFNRTLPPLSDGEQVQIEVLNYVLALLGVIAVLVVYRVRTSARNATSASWLEGEAA